MNFQHDKLVSLRKMCRQNSNDQMNGLNRPTRFEKPCLTRRPYSTRPYPTKPDQTRPSRTQPDPSGPTLADLTNPTRSTQLIRTEYWYRNSRRTGPDRASVRLKVRPSFLDETGARGPQLRTDRDGIFFIIIHFVTGNCCPSPGPTVSVYGLLTMQCIASKTVLYSVFPRFFRSF